MCHHFHLLHVQISVLLPVSHGYDIPFKVQQIVALENLIESKDVFLNFNYTETLEIVYQVKAEKVCHIHGKRGEELIFGHGEPISESPTFIKLLKT